MNPSDFHFLRPLWLLAILPALLLALMIHRRSDATAPWRGIVADHLLPYLVHGAAEKRRPGPVLLLLAGWILASVIVAGPAWKRERSPFADDVAALAIVVKVSPSMETQDLAPDRMTRSVQKVHDLLARRGGAKASLVAYAGTAHVVMPATVDGGIIESFAEALEPGIMPEDGDAAAVALKLADETLAKAGGGSILWITDGIAPEQRGAIAAWRKTSRSAVHVLAPLPESPELDALRDAAPTADATVVPLAADDTDVAKLERASKFASPAPDVGGDRWQDGGYWMTPALALMLLPFFRKGWMPSLAART